MNHSLKKLVREVGEISRQVWIRLLADSVSLEMEFKDFCSMVLHNSIAHWDNFRPLFEVMQDHPSGELSLAEQVSLQTYGDLDHTVPIKGCTQQNVDDITRRLSDVDQVFDYYEVLRWTTTYFWGLQWQIYDSDNESLMCTIWTEALQSGKEAERVLALLDTSVLEAVCITKCKPSPLLEIFVAEFSSCDVDPPQKVIH